VANLPLGIIEPTDYSQFAVKLGRGDIVMLYTDALIEAAKNGDGEQLGEQGLQRLAEQLDPNQPQVMAERLLSRVAQWRGGEPADDDQTLIVVYHNGSGPPRMTLSQSLKSLTKMMGLARV